MIYKTKWFQKQVEKHGYSAYIVSYVFAALIVAIGLEAGYILYWDMSLVEFSSMYAALAIHYSMTGGFILLAFLVGIKSHGKYHRWYLSWALVILIIALPRVIIPIVVDELPKKIDRYFDKIQGARQGGQSPDIWF